MIFLVSDHVLLLHGFTILCYSSPKKTERENVQKFTYMNSVSIYKNTWKKGLYEQFSITASLNIQILICVTFSQEIPLFYSAPFYSAT